MSEGKDSSLEHLILKLVDERPIPVDRIIGEIAKASRLAEDVDLPIVKKLSYLDDLFDENLAFPAMALLPGWKEPGIQILCDIALNGPHYSNAFSILSVIALGRVPSRGEVHFLPRSWPTLSTYEVDAELIQLANRRLRELVLEHLTDPHKKSMLLTAIAHQELFQRDEVTSEERLDFLMGMLIDSKLVLNKTILQRFEELLNQSPIREEELHKFLVEHPVLLDPFVTELRSKQELGDDFITDFVSRRANDEYVVVEIEASTDRLFNQDGNFSAALNTAIGQVRDFQAWLAEHIAYARSKLPGISHPEGLVIIGRRVDLTSQMQKRLSEENFSRRGHIRIITYDDLLTQAQTVYKNALERPVVLRSKDQKKR